MPQLPHQLRPWVHVKRSWSNVRQRGYPQGFSCFWDPKRAASARCPIHLDRDGRAKRPQPRSLPCPCHRSVGARAPGWPPGSASFSPGIASTPSPPGLLEHTNRQPWGPAYAYDQQAVVHLSASGRYCRDARVGVPHSYEVLGDTLV